MTEPTPRDEILTGRDESTPFRAFNRVALVVAAVVVVVGAAAYIVWSVLN